MTHLGLDLFVYECVMSKTQADKMEEEEGNGGEAWTETEFSCSNKF